MPDTEAQSQLHPRHERILELLQRDRMVEVARLSDRLGVSAETIRSDLVSLVHRMLLRRIRGGATSVQPARFVRPLELPSQSFAEEKERIGVMAARMVRNGETILIDAGTTTRAMALALPQDLHDVVVMTSNLEIAISLEDHAGITVMVTGGPGAICACELDRKSSIAKSFAIATNVSIMSIVGAEPRQKTTNSGSIQ